MNIEIDKDFALLYGIMLGDGCLCKVNRKDRPSKYKFISITCSLDDDVPFFEQVVLPILEKLTQRKIKFIFRKDCRAIEIKLHNVELFDFIHSLGFPIGKKENKLAIPKIFYDKELVNYVISGFFATDGSLVLTNNNGTLYPRLEVHAICKELLIETHKYLVNQGMNGAFYESKRVNISPGAFREVHPKYRFQFNGKHNLFLFEKLIGFSNPAYQKKFEFYNQIYGGTENRTRDLSLMRAAY